MIAEGVCGCWLATPGEGGAWLFSLYAGTTNARRLYWIFGSVTGTSPGVILASSVGSVNIPLNPDFYADITIGLANTPLLSKTRGTLDAAGHLTCGRLRSLGALPGDAFAQLLAINNGGTSVGQSFGARGPLPTREGQCPGVVPRGPGRPEYPAWCAVESSQEEPMTEPIHCPACGGPMSHQDFGNAVVDLCVTGCRGIWFDNGELEKLDHKVKGMSPALREALAEPRHDGARGLIDCPRCRGRMSQLQYEVQPAVTVDRCESCGGIFLDAGELAAIRERPLSRTERARIRMRRRYRAARAERKRREEEEALAAHMAVICGLMVGF